MRLIQALLMMGLLGAWASTLAAQPYTPPPYNKGSQAKTFVPLTGGTVLALGDDDMSMPIAPSGFYYRYFSTNYTQFSIGSDGYVLLGAGGQKSTTPAHSAGLALSPFWADLDVTQGGEISWHFQSGVLIVQWLDVPLKASAAGHAVTMQLVLNQSSGFIYFRYGTPQGSVPTTAVPQTAAISGPAGSPTKVITATDAGYIASDGSFTLWPADREMVFVPDPTPIQPVRITDGPLASAPAGVAWQHDFSANLGVKPYTWYIGYPGGLPSGWTLNASSGLLSVAASAAIGTHQFWMEVHDSLNPPGIDLGLFSISFVSAALTITTPATLPQGSAGMPYALQFAASGGVGAYSWTAPNLPAGFAISAQGLLDAPASAVVAGTFYFDVSVTDSAVPAALATLPVSLTISAAPLPLTVTTGSLPISQQGVPYGTQLTATGGNGTYTWDVTVGQLPLGISLAPNGQLSGTTLVTGSFDFTVRVTDDLADTSTKALQLNVASAPAPSPPSHTGAGGGGCSAQAGHGLAVIALFLMAALASQGRKRRA